MLVVTTGPSTEVLNLVEQRPELAGEAAYDALDPLVQTLEKIGLGDSAREIQRMTGETFDYAVGHDGQLPPQ